MNVKKEMKQFSYLYNLEITQSLKIVIPAMILLLIVRVGMFVTGIYSKISWLDNHVTVQGGTVESFAQNYGYISQSELYLNYEGPIFGVFIAVLIFIALYSGYIWLKEWIGNNRTIYSLLTLPISKTYILCSKLATCISIFMIFCATQVVALFIEVGLFNILIPKEIMLKQSITEAVAANGNSIQFITTKDVIYGALGLLSIILIVFTIVLIERSLGLKKSILVTIALVLIGIAMLLIPAFINIYASEALAICSITAIIIIIGGFLWCRYLLNNKVHV